MKICICIVGCGGTGGNLAARMARFLSGYSGGADIRTAFIDGDTVELKNVERQPFDNEDAGENKAVVLAENIAACFGVQVSAFPRYILREEELDHIFMSLYKENAGDNAYINGASDINILVSCVDNHAARKVCHDWFEHSRFLGTVFFIDPANEEVSGEVVIAKKEGFVVTSPDRFWYYPEIADDLGRPVNEMGCEEQNRVQPQHFATNCYAADICFSYIVNIIMCGSEAYALPGGITYFHAFNMFQRFYACTYDEKEARYVREA